MPPEARRGQDQEAYLEFGPLQCIVDLLEFSLLEHFLWLRLRLWNLEAVGYIGVEVPSVDYSRGLDRVVFLELLDEISQFLFGRI